MWMQLYHLTITSQKQVKSLTSLIKNYQYKLSPLGQYTLISSQPVATVMIMTAHIMSCTDPSTVFTGWHPLCISSNTRFLGPIQVHIRNGISIGSTILQLSWLWSTHRPHYTKTSEAKKTVTIAHIYAPLLTDVRRDQAICMIGRTAQSANQLNSTQQVITDTGAKHLYVRINVSYNISD